MAKIAEAYVEISARLDKMNADLNRAKSDFAKASGQMQTQANALSGSITKIKASYELAAGVIGGAFVGAITSAIKSTADHLDALDEMAVKTGVSVEMLTSLELAAKQNGVSMDQLATSIRMMYRSMNEAAEGTKESADAYKRLGVNVRDASGKLKSGNEAFLEVADAVAKIQNPAERSAMAMKVFGRAGSEMLPMLEGGKEALKGYIEQAQRLGLVFTDADAKRAAAFNDQLDILSARLRVFKEKSLLPVLEMLTGLMGGDSGRDVSRASAGFADIAGYVGDIAKGLMSGKSYIEAQVTAAARLRVNIETAAVAAGKYNDEMYGKWAKRPTYEMDVTASRATGAAAPSARKMAAWNPPAMYDSLAMRGMSNPGELIGPMQEVSDTLIDTFTEVGSLMEDVQAQWSSTIAEFIRGGQTFADFMANMFEDVLDGFSRMLGEMASKWLMNSIFNGISSSWLGGGAAATTTAAAQTTININAVDAASFETLARRNAGVITGVVWEQQQYGRAM